LWKLLLLRPGFRGGGLGLGHGGLGLVRLLVLLGLVVVLALGLLGLGLGLLGLGLGLEELGQAVFDHLVAGLGECRGGGDDLVDLGLGEDDSDIVPDLLAVPAGSEEGHLDLALLADAALGAHEVEFHRALARLALLEHLDEHGDVHEGRPVALLDLAEEHLQPDAVRTGDVRPHELGRMALARLVLEKPHGVLDDRADGRSLPGAAVGLLGLLATVLLLLLV